MGVCVGGGVAARPAHITAPGALSEDALKSPDEATERPDRSFG